MKMKFVMSLLLSLLTVNAFGSGASYTYDCGVSESQEVSTLVVGDGQETYLKVGITKYEAIGPALKGYEEPTYAVYYNVYGFRRPVFATLAIPSKLFYGEPGTITLVTSSDNGRGTKAESFECK